MSSALWLLASEAVVIAILRWILHNPGTIGGFIPRQVAAWHRMRMREQELIAALEAQERGDE